jgi:hypothetical protein
MIANGMEPPCSSPTQSQSWHFVLDLMGSDSVIQVIRYLSGGGCCARRGNIDDRLVCAFAVK